MAHICFFFYTSSTCHMTITFTHPQETWVNLTSTWSTFLRGCLRSFQYKSKLDFALSWLVSILIFFLLTDTCSSAYNMPSHTWTSYFHRSIDYKSSSGVSTRTNPRIVPNLLRIAPFVLSHRNQYNRARSWHIHIHILDRTAVLIVGAGHRTEVSQYDLLGVAGLRIS